MTTQTKPPPPSSSTLNLSMRRFTPAEFLALVEAGILTSSDRVELLDGVIIEMAPNGDRHAGTVDIYTEMLPSGVDQGTLLRVQGPLALDEHSRLYPDLMLLSRRADYYRSRPPVPEDVLLLIEVSDSSVDYDRLEKLPRYARAGIPEVWITVLPEEVIEAHTEPTEGGYRVTRRFRAGDVLRPGCFEDIEIPVAAILPGRL
ncbi:MAG: Uma2 family endonuclease [Chloroflexi bacterium]|nr:Uma2 family endonuclease [Chloroflexota bacterium]